MALDPDAVGFVSEPEERRWSSTDCLLYALGVGAGVDELAYTSENTSGADQLAYPTMAVVLGVPAKAAWKAIGKFNWALLVHGGQDIVLHAPIPVDGVISTVTEVTSMADKGKAAVVEFETRSGDAESRQALFTTRWRLFIRGEGGWGQTRGRTPEPVAIPERAPDASYSAETGRDQALLYRLSGDRNPLHSDPAFAARAGFDRPILHGLCTYGVTGRVLLRERCGDDPARFGGMSARFSAPVFPGDRLVVEVWEEGDHDVFRTRKADDAAVLDEGLLLRNASITGAGDAPGTSVPQARS
jgi:acyl dehydratase